MGDKPAMTNLIFEIIMACPSIPDLISKIEINQNSTYVYRGVAELDPDSFDISKSYLTRGREFVQSI